MGGFGSGRNYGKGRRKRSKKLKISQLPELNITKLIKIRKENPGSRWSFHGLGLTVNESVVEIGRGSGEKVCCSPIRFSTLPCHYGGVRYFWHCPACQRRVKNLYLSHGVLACRYCFKMCYWTQNATVEKRLLLKRKRVEARLEDPWKKPERMHKKTFKRLRKLFFNLDHMADFANIFSLRNNRSAEFFLKNFHATEFVTDEMLLAYYGLK